MAVADRPAGADALTVECLLEAGDWPDPEALAACAEAAVRAAAAAEGAPAGEVTVVFADDAAVRALNARWRGKDRPTNVLSFPAAAPALPDGAAPALGDIVLAAGTVAAEAAAQDRPLAHHVAHLVVHGFLHLLGHDHETPAEADAMEQRETRILAGLAIPDPYA